MELNRIFRLLILSFLILSITGCEDDPQTEVRESYTLIVSPATYTFEANGGEFEFEVTAIKTITTISEDLIISDKKNVPFFASISGEGFTLVEGENKVVTDENKGEDRSAILTVAIEGGTGLQKEISLFQKGGFTDTDIVRYVAPVSIGAGNGESAEDAAGFMEPQFWKFVNILLTDRSVEVKFLPGDYSSAFIDDGLILTNVGHEINRLTLTGLCDVNSDDPLLLDNVIFKAPLGYEDKTDILRFNNCQNIHIRKFHFTGGGTIDYVLRITGGNTNNILVEDCSWIDMRGIVFGATGVHSGASNVIYRNCVFKRIGRNTGSHMMYHSYGSSYIGVFDCHFEDCMGDYIRFRARTDYGIVKGSTFKRTRTYPNVTFIAIPCFNDVNPGDEWFGTNFAFSSNQFVNEATTSTTEPISFYHHGFSPAQFNYLLTSTEGETLVNGTANAKTRILKNNFGLEMDQIRITNNTFSTNILQRVTIRSLTSYGAVSLGWTGTAEITDLISTTVAPFDWEFD